MPKNIKTHIYCFDDHHGFSEDVRKKFTDLSRYTILSFPTEAEMLHCLKVDREQNYCKVAVLGLQDTAAEYQKIEQLGLDIKKIDSRTGLILLGPADKMETIRKSIRFNIDAYIPKNKNSILRIHNTVKKIISEHSMILIRKRMHVSMYFLLVFLLLSFSLVLFVLIRFPGYI
jgi:hypothetical protein